MITGFSPRNADFEKAVRDSFALQGAMSHIGAEIVSVAPGWCAVRLPYRAEVSQQHGYFHGGLVSAIGDTAGGYAALTLMPEGASVLTVEFKVNLIAPARGQTLIAHGQVLRPGRTLTVSSVDISVIRGRSEVQCATMLQTLMALAPGRHRPAG